jgi:GTP-binding protein
MFIDQARIYIKAGNGGNGAVSFYRGKYIPNGGPDGGNGGRGGSVFMKAVPNLSTLQNFRFKRKYVAGNGEDGAKAKRAGKKGEDLTIEVPVGTVVREHDTGRLLADLNKEGQTVELQAGGRGGVGNAVFATSTRQAPNFAKPGVLVEGFYVDLELKLLADVGLLGMPNVGKSTFISVVSNARPKIGDYPFTTLEPQLGIATVGDFSFTLADIPGLIEGASEGAGLGLAFLRHIERTRLLVHFIDVSGSEGRDPVEDFHIIQDELENFNAILAERPQIIALNKVDLADPAEAEATKKRFEDMGYECFLLSAASHQGTKELLDHIAAELQKLPETVLYEEPDKTYKVYRLEEDSYTVEQNEDGIFEVSGPYIEELCRHVNFQDTESLQYFQKQLRDKGVIADLEKAGVEEGDTIYLGGLEFEFIF